MYKERKTSADLICIFVCTILHTTTSDIFSLNFNLINHFFAALFLYHAYLIFIHKSARSAAALPVRATSTPSPGVHRRGERVDPHVARPVRVRGLVVQLATANVPHDDVARGVAPQRHVEDRGGGARVRLVRHFVHVHQAVRPDEREGHEAGGEEGAARRGVESPARAPVA